MKLLLYGLNFSPELVGIGKYTGELAATLVKKGHQVTVITAPPYYPQWRVAPGYRADRYSVQDSPNLKVIRCPLWVPRQVSGLKRMLHLISFALSSAQVVQREAKQKPDLIFAIAPAIMAAPAAARAGQRLGICTWLHIQDFEIEAALNLGILKAGTASKQYRLISNIESGIYKRFDRVSSISHKMVERLQGKGVEPEKTIYFPDWVDTEEIHPIDGINEYRFVLGLGQDCIVVLYSGSMGAKQGLEVILASASQLSGEPAIQFVICGEGPAKKGMQEEAKGMKNVHFMPLQPTEKLNQLLNLADIHLIPQKRGATDLVMPSKLLGILASSKPVIAGCMHDSELYNVVSEAGLPIEPESSTALTDAIQTLARDPIIRRKLGAKGRVYCIEYFSREEVIDQFIKEAEKVKI